MDREKEIREARKAAQDALHSLSNAKRELENARQWGMLDLLGGGLFSTYVKHNKLDKAEKYLKDSKRAMNRLKKELRDIDKFADVNIEIDDFLKFADFFFDGIVADWLVQSKIKEAKKQVDTAIAKVNMILRELPG